MTTHPHPEPSEEASSLPVVAFASKGGKWLRQTRSAVSNVALTPHADAQSQLNAMRAERDAALQGRCRITIPTETMQQEFQSYYRRGYVAALKAAPVVDVEAIMRLAEKMMRDSWATGDDSAWHPARDELRAALASPEGSQHD